MITSSTTKASLTSRLTLGSVLVVSGIVGISTFLSGMALSVLPYVQTTTYQVAATNGVTASFQAHRTSGIAPLHVNFVSHSRTTNPGAPHASVSDDESWLWLDCEWDFQEVDPNWTTWKYSGRNRQYDYGCSAAHLFTVPGTYDVTLTVTDRTGAKDVTSQQITVYDPLDPINGIPDNQIVCLSTNGGADFSQCPSATPANHVVLSGNWRTEVTNQLNAGKKMILTSAGGSVSASGNVRLRQGPGIIGVYPLQLSPSTKPSQLRVQGDAPGELFDGRGEDWRIMDIAHTGGMFMESRIAGGISKNVTIFRVDSTHSGDCFDFAPDRQGGPNQSGFGVFDGSCTATALTTGSWTIINSFWFAMQDWKMDGGSVDNKIFRLVMIAPGVVQHSKIGNAGGSGVTMALRGCRNDLATDPTDTNRPEADPLCSQGFSDATDTKWMVISDNEFYQGNASSTPTNRVSSQQGRRRLITIERNIIRGLWGAVNFIGDATNVTSQHVRRNIFIADQYGTKSASQYRLFNAGGSSNNMTNDDRSAYDNTLIYTEGGAHIIALSSSQAGANHQCSGNLGWAQGGTTGSLCGGQNISINQNNWRNPTDYSGNPFVGTSLSYASPVTDFRLKNNAPVLGGNDCLLVSPRDFDLKLVYGSSVCDPGAFQTSPTGGGSPPPPPPSPICGNGIIESGEQCDDGNVINNDGCDDQCVTEADVCTTYSLAEFSTCFGQTPTGTCAKYDLNGTGSINVTDQGLLAQLLDTCATCGNGVIETGEQCDDSNTINGDGCDNRCQQEIDVCSTYSLSELQSCFGLPPIDTCAKYDLNGTGDINITDQGLLTQLLSNCSVCGNGVVEFGEQCDYGNTTDNDGDNCSATCQREWCGDGIVQNNNLLANQDGTFYQNNGTTTSLLERCEGNGNNCDALTCQYQQTGGGCTITPSGNYPGTGMMLLYFILLFPFILAPFAYQKT